MLKEALNTHFGFTDFLDGQEEVITELLQGHDVCVIMPTGAGKSLCFQLPILMRDGYGLVISPLISLMKDQVDALVERNIPAAYINSTVPVCKQRELLELTADRVIKILYAAPERFRGGLFYDFISRNPPQLLIIDEAHCISQWGHDFRPDYLRIGKTVSDLSIPQICAFTATATPLVRNDIRKHLQREKMRTHVTGFQRPNLAFSVLQCSSASSKLEKLRDLLATPQPTIIYTSTRKAVDEIVAAFDCIGYHAGYTDMERTQAQNRFMTDPCPVLAATNAFGMGIDRADIRRVIHYNLPGSLEAYYQEAGRAGRDGESAECILLFAYQDRFIQEFLIELNNPSRQLIEDLHTHLRQQALKHPGQQLELKLAELTEQIPGAKSERQLSSALKVLEKHNYLERSYRRENRGLLIMQDDLKELRMLNQLQETQRSRFIFRIIEEFGTRLNNGIRCSYEELAQASGLRITQVQRVLRVLHGECLSWRPPFSGRGISLLEPQREKLDIDFERLTEKRDFDMARLEDIIAYTRTQTCRQLFVIDYFGQTLDDWHCEICDLCRKMDMTHRHTTVCNNNDDLFQALRKLRAELAAERGVPAYRILSNDALQGLTNTRPVTVQESTRIKGIGPQKSRTIVPRFLDTIRIWRQQNESQ